MHTSLVEPLPHQITAVSEGLLPRQQLRFLLADDPGAGKTIMTGLLMKELIVRGALQRCLVVCPGSLAEQWQDELYQRFHLNFEIFTNDKAAAARTGNWFLESKAQEHAVTHVVPEHLQEIRSARLNLLAKTEAAVKDRLTKEIAYWDHRASQLRDEELAGSPCTKLKLRRGARIRCRPASSSGCANSSSKLSLRRCLRWCSAACSWFRKVCSRPSAESARLHPTTCATPRSPPPGRVPSSWTPSAPSASSPPTGRRSISGTTSRAAGPLLIY